MLARRSVYALFVVVAFFAAALPSPVHADFVFGTFNDTTGLVFVGNAATSSCDEGLPFRYQPRHGTNDGLDNGTLPILQTESTVHTEAQSQATDDRTTSDRIRVATATTGHRDEFGASPDLLIGACDIRLRITSSQPCQLGAVWRQLPVPIFSGFQTMFRFQITDLTRSCTEVRDRHFHTFHHESCMVHGGDGFAFVLHLDPNATQTLGRGGEDMGYGGIRNALVFEFDTWYNPDQGDLFTDHVSVQLSGPDGPITVGEHSRLSTVKPHPLADGLEHVVKIVYYNFINYDFIDDLTASSALLPFLKDGGEGRRIGTLALFLDNMTAPIIAFPINLPLSLNLPTGEVYAGFTASTGRAWQKHDIIDWTWCDLPDCPLTDVDPAFASSNLDYHTVDILNFRR